MKRELGSASVKQLSRYSTFTSMFEKAQGPETILINKVFESEINI